MGQRGALKGRIATPRTKSQRPFSRGRKPAIPPQAAGLNGRCGMVALSALRRLMRAFGALRGALRRKEFSREIEIFL